MLSRLKTLPKWLPFAAAALLLTLIILVIFLLRPSSSSTGTSKGFLSSLFPASAGIAAPTPGAEPVAAQPKAVVPAAAEPAQPAAPAQPTPVPAVPAAAPAQPQPTSVPAQPVVAQPVAPAPAAAAPVQPAQPAGGGVVVVATPIPAIAADGGAAGNVVVVPAQPAQPAAPVVVDGNAAPNGLPCGQTVEYTVQPGENVFRIALNHGTTAAAVGRLNGLSNVRLVASGKRLTILTCDKSGGSGGRKYYSAARGRYVVKAGDNLFRIALRHGMSTEALCRANGLSSTLIRVGQVLVIP